MSIRPVLPGKESSEWSKALRAEALGAVLAVAGAAWAIWAGSMPAAVVAAAGAWLVGHTASGYASARGAVKAAAHAPPAVRVPPRGL